MANDGGHLILSAEERQSFIAQYPAFAGYIREYLGSVEFINGDPRYCLWLVNCPPQVIQSCSEVRRRLAEVRKAREESSRPATQALARTPALFGENRQPTVPYLAIPKTSSERRFYIPMSILPSEIVASTELFTLSSATLWDFGVLTSAMHMAWVRTVCGRLKSDYRYSATLVYNNYPWPQNVTDRQRAAAETAAQAVLDARGQYHDSTLADLYDPLSMPAPLVRAHANLDRAVDRCYRSQPFPHERNRVEYLFEQYEGLNGPLVVGKNGKRVRRK